MTSLAIEQQALLDALFTRPQVVQPDSAINLIAVSAYIKPFPMEKRIKNIHNKRK